MPTSIASAQFPDLLKPGQTVYLPASGAEPLLLRDALEARPGAARGVNFLAAWVPGINTFDYAGLHEKARATTFFVMPQVRESFAAGKVRVLPLNYAAIARWLAEARIAYRETGKARGEALCWHRLGAVSLRSGDLDEAVTCFGTARDLCQQNQDGQGFANALHQIGTILMQRQQYEQARAHSRSALSVQHEIGDRAGVARSLYQIACAFMEENNIAEAVTGYRHAIKVMKSVEDLAGVAMSFYHLALLAHRTGRAGGAYRLMLVCGGGQPGISRTGTKFSRDTAR